MKWKAEDAPVEIHDVETSATLFYALPIDGTDMPKAVLAAAAPELATMVLALADQDSAEYQFALKLLRDAR